MGVEGASSRCSVAFTLSDNIGDDVQSLALSGLLRGGIRVYPRDFLSEVPRDIESGVLSGWLSRNRRPFDGEWLAGKMLPLSFFLGNGEHFRGHWLDYFRAARLVVTRDVATRDRLRKLGVDAEFGGCFSLFTARALPFRLSGGVPYVVCTEEESFRAMCAEGDDVAVFFNPVAVPRKFRLDLRARISACLFWLWLIRGARALYTNRLHAALPAVSYGTGVYRDPDCEHQPERFSGYEEMLVSRDAEKGLIGVDRIDELTDALQRCGKDVPLLEFGFRSEMGIREMYADILKRGQLASTEEEIDAGFKRGAVLFRDMLKVCGRGGGSGDLPEVVSYANEVADSYIPSAREVADSYVSELLPREFRGYWETSKLRGYIWRLGAKIKGMLRRLGLI